MEESEGEILAFFKCSEHQKLPDLVKFLGLGAAWSVEGVPAHG